MGRRISVQKGEAHQRVAEFDCFQDYPARWRPQAASKPNRDIPQLHDPARTNTCRVRRNTLSSSISLIHGSHKNMDERRASQRIPMGLPVEIRWKTPGGSLKQATGTTGNISGSGLFIQFPLRLKRATALAIKVVLPRGVNQSPLELSCQGRVVRWEKDGQAEGLCVVIDEYELHPLAGEGNRGKRSGMRPARSARRRTVTRSQHSI